MNHGPHLIVLRGNSASGKSTVASELQRSLGPGTANIGQDHFRRVVLREHDVADGDDIGVFYLEVSLDEALRRHQERPLAMEVSPAELRRWYVPSDLLGVPGEVVLDATADVPVTVGAIMSALGNPISIARDVRRFL